MSDRRSAKSLLAVVGTAALLSGCGAFRPSRDGERLAVEARTGRAAGSGGCRDPHRPITRTSHDRVLVGVGDRAHHLHRP